MRQYNRPVAELEYIYDNSRNRLSGQKSTVKDTVINTEYVYSSSAATPDLISAIKQNGSTILSYGYDNLNRLSTRTLGTTTPFVTEYYYLNGRNKGSTTTDANLTTTLLQGMANGDDAFLYTYDDLNNITSVKRNGTVVELYTYDNLNQLATATLGNDLFEYTYDNGGNILSVKKNGVTQKTYTYGNSEWKDLLTSYNGEAITYDQIGNPTSYRDGMNFTWCEGRRLSTATHGTNSFTYNYNQDGLRTSKIGRDIATNQFTNVDYYWLGGKLQGERVGGRYTTFLYDQNSSPYGFYNRVGSTGEYYYYIYNAQGDVIGILDSTGTQVVEYTYNPWGEILSITGTLADTIGQQNPLRYRGYYYDNETGLYYLQSRYYDPITGRFINADGYVSTGQDILGYNMFAYCGNNPVNYTDSSGQFWEEAKLFFIKTINALAESFRIEFGAGYGIGLNGTINGIDIEAEAYQDGFTLGYDNDDYYTAIKGNIGVGASILDSLSLENSFSYEHRFETNFKRDVDEHTTFSSPQDVLDCEKTTKERQIVSFFENGDARLGGFVGIDFSFHCGLGGHFLVGWDIDEFYEEMIK